MTRHRLPFLLALTVTALLTTAQRSAALCSTTTAQTWTCWEKTLNATAGSLGGNPYRDVKLKVTFTQFGQPTLTTYAFYDGTTVFKFRMAFPAAGTWNWSSTCEAGCTVATGLIQSDTVTVSAYGGSNRLYANGYLKVQDNATDPSLGRYLVHANGKPFFWLGDTPWNGPTRATAADWEEYTGFTPGNVNNRGALGFTVLQVALPVDYMANTPHATGQPVDALGRAPFSAGCSASGVQLPDNCVSWTPAFWRDFDKKIQQANDQGMVVVVVGLMERVIESLGYTSNIAQQRTYARNVVARLAGSHVIFSPGFDRKPNVQNGVDLAQRIKDIGNEVAAASTIQPSGQPVRGRFLVTNHWAGSMETTEMQPFQTEGWLAFQMFQSGHASSASNCDPAVQLQLITQRPRTMPAPPNLWSYTPTKPSVNGESIYDQGNCKKVVSGSPVYNTTNHNPRRARQTAYLSMLSGATGTTFGVKGVFDWERSIAEPQPLTWRQGIAQRSSQEMKHLKTLFTTFAPALPGQSEAPWQNLLPSSGRIQNQVPDTQQQNKMVAAQDVNRTFLVAYLPDNATIRIRFANLPVGSTGRWFNPRTGLFLATPAAVGVQDLVDPLIYTFTRPACPGGDPFCASEPDWVLVIP